jgi:hypothetical protein
MLDGRNGDIFWDTTPLIVREVSNRDYDDMAPTYRRSTELEAKSAQTGRYAIFNLGCAHTEADQTRPAWLIDWPSDNRFKCRRSNCISHEQTWQVLLCLQHDGPSVILCQSGRAREQDICRFRHPTLHWVSARETRFCVMWMMKSTKAREDIRKEMRYEGNYYCNTIYAAITVMIT